MRIQVRQLLVLSLFLTLNWLSQTGRAQGITLPASGTYTETFDNLGTGLPPGWTVQTGASTNPPSLGNFSRFASMPTAWSEQTTGFRNVASADGLSQTATPSEQAGSTDRALGVRQTSSFGDPGAAFMLQLANTLGVNNPILKFKIQSLDLASSRTTTWRVEYGLGQTPAVYFQVGSPFTTGGSTFSNVEIPISLSNLNNNSGPVRLRIIANSPSSGNGERPTTAIDDVTLTYSTNTFIARGPLNTLTYGVGAGPATQNLTLEGIYLTGGPGSLTVVSNNSAFTVSSDGITFGSSAVVPYSADGTLSTIITFRLEAGLPVGGYRNFWSIRGGGNNPNIFYAVSGIVTQTPNDPTIAVNPTSLTGTNGFRYSVGFGPQSKFLSVSGANLIPVPGSYTIRSSNPSAFQLIGSNNQRAGTVTLNYNNANPSDQFVTVVMVEGLATGEYSGTLTVEGGLASPVTIPVSGTVSTAAIPPTLVTVPTALAVFSTVQGTPSVPQALTVAGRNFGGSGVVTVEAPAGFEVAVLSSSFYSQTSSFGFNIGSDGAFNSPIRVRMAGATVGSFSGNVIIRTGPFTLTLPVTGTVNPTGTQPLSVTAASYNCQTGALTFGRIGGDPNRTVEYEAIGVKGYSTSPNGVIEAEKRGDPNSGTTVTLKARYVGDPASEVTFVFNFGTFCAGGTTPTPTGLQLIEPLYNCQTGAITFRTQGGDGTPIEYGAIGVKPFSTNPSGTIEAEKRGDPNSGTTVDLKARQSGKEVSLLFDFAAYCRNRNARQASDEVAGGLRVAVLGNPVGNELTVEVSGVTGRPVQLRLTDLRGAVLEQRTIPVATGRDRQTFSLYRQPPGLLLLQAVSGGQTQTVKVLKP